jgi:hypothetical protein
MISIGDATKEVFTALVTRWPAFDALPMERRIEARKLLHEDRDREALAIVLPVGFEEKPNEMSIVVRARGAV